MTYSCIDNILVDKSIVIVEELVNQLKKFGLTAKLPEAIEEGIVLRFKIARDKISKLVFH